MVPPAPPWSTTWSGPRNRDSAIKTRYPAACRTISRVRVLLISTYELGHEPLAVASPARRLVDAGHEVKALDLSVQPFAAEPVLWADRVAISVPMHTALRLARPVLEEVRSISPLVPTALYGLYAAVGLEAGYPADAALVGEYETALLDWVTHASGGVTTDLTVGEYRAPVRGLVEGAYASLETSGGLRKAGYVETSHGCRHRCRHCPIPAVYDGRFRIVDAASVLEDIDYLATSGVEHITFGDPDFWNGPAHSMRILEEAHALHPELTFDVTIKVEHLIGHRRLLPRLSAAGVLFVVSAFESTNESVLHSLDKGHTLEDMHVGLSLCRDAGVDVHPTWLPFTPWTALGDLAEIFGFLDAHQLFDITDPVQLGLRLLVPPGSLVLEVEDVVWGEFDADGLSHTWTHPDDRVETLQAEVAWIAAAAADSGEDRSETLVRMWQAALTASGEDPGRAQIQPGEVRARITEPWFC